MKVIHPITKEETTGFHLLDDYLDLIYHIEHLNQEIAEKTAHRDKLKNNSLRLLEILKSLLEGNAPALVHEPQKDKPKPDLILKRRKGASVEQLRNLFSKADSEMLTLKFIQ